MLGFNALRFLPTLEHSDSSFSRDCNTNFISGPINGADQLRADRLLGILLTLEKKKKVTARELAEEFEVSIRTIYRDILTLSGDFHIQVDRGQNGGYSLIEGYRFPRLPFSKKEVTALHLMGSVLGQKLGLIEGKVFNQAFKKLLSGFPREYRADSDRHSELVLIDLEPWQPKPEVPGTAETIKRGMDESRILEFTYRKISGRPEKKEVEPYGICYRGKFWYLVGFCRKWEDYRLYRTDRIYDIRITRKTFTRNPSFNLREYWEKDLPEKYRQSGKQVRIAFDPSLGPEIRKTSWPCGDLKILPDGRLELIFRTFDLERLASFVLSFGSRAELLEPVSLREEILDRLRAALEKYGTKAQGR